MQAMMHLGRSLNAATGWKPTLQAVDKSIGKNVGIGILRHRPQVYRLSRFKYDWVC
jgi:hypothetical protein